MNKNISAARAVIQVCPVTMAVIFGCPPQLLYSYGMQHAGNIFTGNFFSSYRSYYNVEKVSETEYYYAYRKTSDRSLCLLLEHLTYSRHVIFETWLLFTASETTSGNIKFGIIGFFCARQQNASRILAIVWASVRPSVHLSICHTRDLYQNGAS